MTEPYQEERPWGWFRQFSHNEKTTVKILHVKASATLSLQTHEHRSEFWRVLSGSPVVTIGEKKTVARAGDEFFVERGEKHRLAGGEEESEILEVAFGDFDESDIKRYEDAYGRI